MMDPLRTAPFLGSSPAHRRARRGSGVTQRLALAAWLAGSVSFSLACDGASEDPTIADAAVGAPEDAALPKLDATRPSTEVPADGTADGSTLGSPDGGARDASAVQGDAGRVDAAAVLPDASTGADDRGPSACLPLFKPACSPQIVFKNDEPMGRGAIFAQVIPDAEATMQDVACTVCSILFRSPDEIPQKSRHKSISLTLQENENLADASGNTIRVDLDHIAGYKDKGKALLEFRGVLVHETAHLYQHYGNGGLGEGMADFVRIRVGLYERGRRSTGGSWTDPYTTSGFFFSWLAGPGVYHQDGRDPHDVDIGYAINKIIGEKGPDAVPGLLMQKFGKSVDALWDEYQDAIR